MKHVNDICQLNFNMNAKVPTRQINLNNKNQFLSCELNEIIRVLFIKKQLFNLPVLTKFQRNPFRFCEIKSLIVVVSADSRESMSPVFTLSKNPMSCSINDLKTNFLSLTLRRDTAIVNKHVLTPPNIPLLITSNSQKKIYKIDN